MHTDTIAIIVAILGTGLALWRANSKSYEQLRQDLDSRHKDLRQDLAEIRQEVRADIAALNSRIDALYQALFSRKDPAA